MTQTQNGPGPRPASPETDPESVRREAVQRYLFEPEFHARVHVAYGVVKNIAGLDLEGARIGCIVATHLAEQALPEWPCPSCGATTRARMADHEHDHAEDHVLADVLRKLLAEAGVPPGERDLDYRTYRENGQTVRNHALPYLALTADVDLTDEQYRAVQEAIQ